MTYERADALGLIAPSTMLDRALAILRKPWNPAESTAQPPIDCPHETFQTTNHGPACAVCGALPSVHHAFYWRRGLP